jgi:predicted Zn-dependent protease
MEAWSGLLDALKAQGATDRTEAVLLSLLARYPDNFSFLVAYADAAGARGDWAAAEQRWRAMQDRFADRLRVTAGLAEALLVLGRAGEAETVAQTALARFPDTSSILSLAARCAAARGDWAEADRRWAAVLAKSPDHPAGSIGRAEALVHLGQAEAAEAVLRVPAERFADRLDVQLLFATVAVRRGDWATALTRYSDLRARFPVSADAWLGCIEALAALRQPAEADALLQEAAATFPQHMGIMSCQARFAEQRNDWAGALALWQALAARRADNAGFALGLARALRMLARFEDAAEVLATAREQHPKSSHIAIEYATQAAVTADWPAALERWRDVLDRFGGGFADAHTGLAQALLRLDQAEEAETAAQTGLERFPNNAGLRCVFAAIAQQQGHWRIALDRWRAAAEVSPREMQITIGISECEWILAGEEPVAGDTAPPARAPVVMTPTAAPREIMMCYESLGSNCEFGLVQRHYLAEPLGLLRWSFVLIDELIEWLDNDFAGIGLEENTDLVGRDGNYIVRDNRYELTMHTFQPVGSLEHNRFFQQQCRRLRYLRGKLLDDLAAASKIFIYKAFPTATPRRDQVLRLHRALQRHGPNTLLYLELAEPGHPHGLVEEIEPGLLWGHIDHFSRDNLHDISYRSWLDLCSTAYGMSLDRLRVPAEAESV